MIQEKDFLYRIPVKTAPITTPRGQIRNPEILVDLEGGEFMHGNILDANSTNKLISQSVKDAVDDMFTENGYAIKNLLEAETSARTKGDEALSAKIQAEQTRAEGKEKEIIDEQDLLRSLIITEHNRAIASEKSIADDLNGKLAQKVDTTTLDEQVGTLNAAIDTKQPKGNYLTEHQSLEEYAKKVELPTVPTKVSELQNDSEFIAKSVYDKKIAALEARIAALEAKHPEAAE